MAEAHLSAFDLQSSKFFQWNIALNRQVLERWSQVLPNRQDSDSVLTQIMHNFDHLIPGFTKAEHEAGLGWRSQGSSRWPT